MESGVLLAPRAVRQKPLSMRGGLLRVSVKTHHPVVVILALFFAINLDQFRVPLA